jgi:RimJ/RimL family protein N-acetyltransferase
MIWSVSGEVDVNVTIATMTALALPSPLPSDGVIVLRPWSEGDVDRSVIGFADPVVQRFAWPHQRPYTRPDAVAFLDFVRREQASGSSLQFAIWDARDPGETALGGGSVYDIDQAAGRAAVGYWLAAGARGRGYATRATRLAARVAFDTLGLARLELTCAPDNLASQAVAGRAGFTREAHLRSHMRFKGGRRDTLVFGLLSGEAAASSASSASSAS